MTNIFREAKQLLDKKDAGSELTQDDLQLIAVAVIPLLLVWPSPEDRSVAECLEALAKIVEEVEL